MAASLSDGTEALYARMSGRNCSTLVIRLNIAYAQIGQQIPVLRHVLENLLVQSILGKKFIFRSIGSLVSFGAL
jgi:hypothetical protein